MSVASQLSEQGILAETLHVPDRGQRVSRSLHVPGYGQPSLGPSPTPGHLVLSPALSPGHGHVTQQRQQQIERQIAQQQHHNVHFHQQAHTVTAEDLLPPPGHGQVTSTGHQQTAMYPAHFESGYKDETHESPLLTIIFVILLFVTFLINLNMTLTATYAHDNFTRHVVSVATNKSMIFSELFILIGLAGVFLANSMVLWTFSFCAISLLFTLIAIESSVGGGQILNYANLATLGAVSAQLGFKFRDTIQVWDAGQV